MPTKKLIKQPIWAGDKVVFHTGVMGSEQGHFHPRWWPEDKPGVVVKTGPGKVLIEFSNGEREWANLGYVERQTTRRT